MPRAYGAPVFPLRCLTGNPSGEEVRDGPHSDNRCGGNRACVAPTAAPLRSQAGSLSGFRPFGVDRNICHFLWYGGVAGDGLRSVGDEAPLLIQERVLYPAHRHLRAGALRGSGLFVYSSGNLIEIKSLRALVVRPLLPPVWRAQRAQQLGQHCGQHCSNLPCLSHRPLYPRVGAFLPFGSGPSLFAPPDALSH